MMGYKFRHLWRTAIVIALAASGIATAYAQSGAHKTVYDYMPNTALSGIVNPDMSDRSGINKAWPKAPANINDIRVGWTEITLDNPWFAELIRKAKALAPKMGFDLSIQVANGNVATQCAQIDAFIARKEDVIVVDPTQVSGVAKCINRAVAAGIPVVAIGTVPASTAHILTTITPNPYANGFAVGRYLAKQMGDKPITAAVLIGVLGNSTSESRVNGEIGGIVYQRSQNSSDPLSKEQAELKGFKHFEYLKKNGHVEIPETGLNIVAMAVGNWTITGGLNATQTILAAHGHELSAILSDNDYMAQGALRAIRGYPSAGKIQIVAAGDGDRTALKLIKEGKLLATATWSPDEVAQATFEFLNNIFRKELDPRNLPMGSYFPGGAITKENMAQYWDPNPKNKYYKYTVPPVKSIPELRKAASS